MMVGWHFSLPGPCKSMAALKPLTEAVRLYRFAADRGHVIGLYNLGQLYETGRAADSRRAMMKLHASTVSPLTKGSLSLS